MHELAIAQSILETVLREQERRDLPAVVEVGVRVGALSGVLPDALRFSFDALVHDTPLATCRLALEAVPARGRCRACAQDFEVEAFLFCCPSCSSGQVQVIQGYELDIAYLEVDDEDVDENADASSVNPKMEHAYP